ncbi:MAG TPA: extracellular solute-binding protein [Patescibacteria group bacterium]|nr:extracellular solute-binding protein [Patescibacteria group bacterium]
MRSSMKGATGKARRVAASTGIMIALLAGCVGPGGEPEEEEAATEEPTEEPTDEASAEDTETEAEAEPAAAPDCGTDDVVLNAVFETGFELPNALAEEFTNQHPNVTFDISQDQFNNLITSSPRLLSGENPPDLIRLPTMVSLVQDGLLKNLDEYASAFGWDEWPDAQLSQNRVAEDGTRGSGSLYAMGLNSSLTGVFYNRELAEQIGMDEPPATVEEFDAALAAAADAGLQPIMQWNATASGGGLAFPLQHLMASYGEPTPINEWIFQQPGATIDTESNLQAAEHLQGWIEAGYFPEDANALEYTDANARFRAGEAVFIFNGDWENASYNSEMGENVGFFVFPPLEEGGPLRAMSSPLTFGIAADAPNADCAAYFFDWVATNETAREINVEIGGSNPGGPTDLPIPPAEEGSVTNETLEAGGEVAADNGQMDFIANATGSIFAEGWTPALQEMIGGRQDAAGLLETVQAEYESQVQD